MRDFLLISAGAVVGANLRYWVATYFASRLGQAFPFGTLFVNITGSFLIGFVLTFIDTRLNGTHSIAFSLAQASWAHTPLSPHSATKPFRSYSEVSGLSRSSTRWRAWQAHWALSTWA